MFCLVLFSFAGLAGGVWVWVSLLPWWYFTYYDWDVCTDGISMIYHMKIDYVLSRAAENFGI